MICDLLSDLKLRPLQILVYTNIVGVVPTFLGPPHVGNRYIIYVDCPLLGRGWVAHTGARAVGP